MKTTLEISTPLLRRAKKVAAQEGTTLRALVEQGLAQTLAQRCQGSPQTSHSGSIQNQPP